ncbi:MAG TPA: hypothetical protein H9829_09360 [Candidatus Tetragenococcus pullicola]|nr:hypothetical protein [Candidatus Tetragenococcus pullicola]
MNQLQTYAIPNEIPKQEDYLLRMRPVGSDKWEKIEAYQVKVDMHDVREASMIYFDFQGAVELEITFPKFYTVYDVQIRPTHLKYPTDITEKKIIVTINKPGNFSLEINKDRFHNLHIFAGTIEEVPDKEDENTGINLIGDRANKEIEKMPKDRLIYIEAGIHYISSYIWTIPSNTRVYLEPGAVLMGGLAVENNENVRIFGRGVVYQGHLLRPYFTDGFSIRYSQNIAISGVCFINPLHYTISFEQSERVQVENVKTFSCYGWSDGFDMVSSSHITIDNCFLRTSDDCIAVYASRKDSFGSSCDVTVKNSVLWADVAHPFITGTHGSQKEPGDIIENISLENIDILEHHEFQPNYLGALAINPGDNNLIKNVSFKDIRIDAFEHGRVFDIRVKFNKDYNPMPGKGIEDVLFEDIAITSGPGEEVSLIAGYDEERLVKNITFKNIYRDGIKMTNLKEANISVGDHTENIKFQ